MSTSRYDINCVGNKGCLIPAKESVILKSTKYKGLIKIHNTSPTDKQISPSKKIQDSFGKNNLENILKAENIPNHQPIAWDSPALLIEVILLNNDLSLGGNRQLSNQVQQHILTNHLTMNKLCSLVEPIPGSESSRFTVKNYLGYRLSKWVQMESSLINHDVKDKLVLHLDGKIETSYLNSKLNKKVFLIKSALPCGNSWIDVAFVMNKFNYQCQSIPLEDYFKSISTSGCISLLQKIIPPHPFPINSLQSINK